MYNNHAYRGKEFELRLSIICNLINSKGGFAHKLQPEYNTQDNSRVLTGEPFDFIIAVPGELHCFEAKSTYENRWYIRAGKFYSQTYNRRERANLTRIKLALGDNVQCYFLVWFRKVDRLVRFDTELINSAVDHGLKSLTPDDGIPWRSGDLIEKCPGYDVTAFIAGHDAHLPVVRHSERTLPLLPNMGGVLQS